MRFPPLETHISHDLPPQLSTRDNIAPCLFDTARWQGKRIGLFGGTFDPPHAGHVYIANAALRWLSLDAVWWLVSPGHPLKNAAAHSQNYEDRLAQCRALVNHPRIFVSDLERQLNSFGTYELVDKLRTRHAASQFVFVGGMDLHASFHRWHDWERLVQSIPISFFARPPVSQLVQSSHIRGMAHRAISQTVLHKPLHKSVKLNAPHIYWIKSSRLLNISSTHLRRCRIASAQPSAVE